MNTDKKIQEAVAMGERNIKIAKLAQNFCRNLKVEKSRLGGTGIVEEMTGLPIGLMECRCQYARAHGLAGGDSEAIALDFYDRNCTDCDKREAVGMPSLLNLVDERNKKAADEAEKRVFDGLTELLHGFKEIRMNGSQPETPPGDPAPRAAG